METFPSLHTKPLVLSFWGARLSEWALQEGAPNSQEVGTIAVPVVEIHGGAGREGGREGWWSGGRGGVQVGGPAEGGACWSVTL